MLRHVRPNRRHLDDLVALRVGVGLGGAARPSSSRTRTESAGRSGRPARVATARDGFPCDPFGRRDDLGLDVVARVSERDAEGRGRPRSGCGAWPGSSPANTVSLRAHFTDEGGTVATSSSVATRIEGWFYIVVSSIVREPSCDHSSPHGASGVPRSR